MVALNVKLYFNNTIFHHIIVNNGLLHINADIYISNNVTFSDIMALSIINGSLNHKINLVDNVHISIINVTTAQSIFTLKDRPVLFYPFCYFQYKRTLHSNWTVSQKVTIVFKNTNKIFDTNSGNINCEFQQHTMYHGLNPLEVYLQHIQVEHKKLFDARFLCYCQDMQPHCHTNTLGSVYPGQNSILQVSLNPKIITNKAMPCSSNKKTLSLMSQFVECLLCLKQNRLSNKNAQQ